MSSRKPRCKPLTTPLGLFAVVSTLLCCESASAGGIMVYEAGQEGAGLANAGSAVLSLSLIHI